MSDMDSNDRSRERGRRDRPSRFTERSRDRSTDRGRERGGAKSSSCRVYVSNIPYEYRWQDLKDLFRDEVGEVQFVELFVDENDKPRGCGIVEFSDQQSVKKCLEKMQRYDVKGRQLIIKEDNGNKRDKYGHIIGSGGGRRGRDDSRVQDDRLRMSGQGISSDSKWGNTYGLSANFLESLGINVPLCNRVFVANLHYDVDKKKLKEVFRLAGRVMRVDLHKDKDGNSRGFAVVEFDHPVEAVQAISMFNNQLLLDRVMTVRMDRVNDNIKLPEGLKGIGMGLGPKGEPLRDIVHNLPSISNNTSNQTVTNGAGILGAVPNPALQVASALGLGSVVGNSALSGLASNPAALQAATLTNLLSNGLAGGDLSNLVSNSSQIGGNSSSGNLSAFGRDNQTPAFSSNQNFGSGRNFDSFDSGKGSGLAFGNGSFSNRGQGMGSNLSQGGRFSSKVLVSNLPSTASYKMLHEKFGEFGEVQHIEEKGNGSMLVVYNSDWQAERAIRCELFNILPLRLKDSQSLQNFKKEMKQLLLQDSFYTVEEFIQHLKSN